MIGSHLLLLAHAAAGGAGDYIERLIRQNHDASQRRPEPPVHLADGRRSARRRLRDLG